MRSSIYTMVLLVLLFGTMGCTDPMYGLRDVQKTDIRIWEEQGIEIVKEKDPAKATRLGFFIGLGSFYTDQPVLGVVDLLTWPLSIMWEPWIATAEANKINYEATKDAWMRKNGLGIYGQMQQAKLKKTM